MKLKKQSYTLFYFLLSAVILDGNQLNISDYTLDLDPDNRIVLYSYCQGLLSGLKYLTMSFLKSKPDN